MYISIFIFFWIILVVSLCLCGSGSVLLLYISFLQLDVLLLYISFLQLDVLILSFQINSGSFSFLLSSSFMLSFPSLHPSELMLWKLFDLKKIVGNLNFFFRFSQGYNARKVISEVYASFVLQFTTVFGR